MSEPSRCEITPPVRFNVSGLPAELLNSPLDLDKFKIRILRAMQWQTKNDNLALNDLEFVFTNINRPVKKDASATDNNPKQPTPRASEDTEWNREAKAKQYQSRDPLFTYDQLVLSDSTKKDIEDAIALQQYERLIFDEWGLRSIEPFPRSALNFYGPPGTGKTMAAHAIAKKLGRKILVSNYADIESKYHGDGPKNMEAVFYAAERDKSILFIDESDSLLSKRLTNVTQGSEQAINSMRSQLLICLEKFSGVVIFATNLASNYDQAFLTRVKHIFFPLPGINERKQIWRRHLVPGIPGADELLKRIGDSSQTQLDLLAEHSEGLCGRDIKNIVISGCLQAARGKAKTLRYCDLFSTMVNVRKTQEDIRIGTRDTVKLTDDESKTLTETALKQIGLDKGDGTSA